MPRLVRICVWTLVWLVAAPVARAQERYEPNSFAPPTEAAPLEAEFGPASVAPAHERTPRYARERGEPTIAPAAAAAPLSSAPLSSAPLSSAPRGAAPALPLPAAAPLKLELPDQVAKTASPRASGLPSFVSVLGSLAVVVGLLLLTVWALKRTLPKGQNNLPSGVVEILGRSSLAARQHVHLVRVGNKLLLVAVSAAGAETLTEITDPVEVDRLCGLCAQAQPDSVSNTFRQVFQQFTRAGGATESPPAERPRYAAGKHLSYEDHDA